MKMIQKTKCSVHQTHFTFWFACICLYSRNIPSIPSQWSVSFKSFWFTSCLLHSFDCNQICRRLWWENITAAQLQVACTVTQQQCFHNPEANLGGHKSPFYPKCQQWWGEIWWPSKKQFLELKKSPKPRNYVQKYNFLLYIAYWKEGEEHSSGSYAYGHVYMLYWLNMSLVSSCQ